MLDAVCAWKVGSLAFKLLAGASKALDHESIATFLEIGANSVEAGEVLHDRQRDVVRAAAARLQAQIERNSDEWLRSEFGSWAMTQNNLGNVLSTLGQRESETARPISSWEACLTVASSAWSPRWVQTVRSKRDYTVADIVRRSTK